MTALREMFAKFDVSFDTSALERGSNAVNGMFGQLQKLGSALAGAAVIGGIVKLTKATIETGDQLSTTADRLGISADALQQWSYAADLADVSAEEFAGSMKILQRNIFAAKGGGGDIAQDFKKLGVTVTDSSGNLKDLDAIIEQSADGFAKLTNPIERVALAQKLFGRGGAALVPLLARGSAGVAELKAEFAALGGGLNEETVAAANEADDAFKRLQYGLKSLVMNAMKPFILFATYAARGLTWLVVKFRELEKGSQFVTAALVTLTAVAASLAWGILSAFAPIIVPFLAISAAILAIILIVDDLIVMFHGGKSAIGDFLDTMFGLGASQKVVKFLTDAWFNLIGTIQDAWHWFEEGRPVLEFISAAIHEMGDAIGFVVDQMKNISQFGDGLKEIARDIGIKIGVSKPREHAGGAEGIASEVTRAPGAIDGSAFNTAEPAKRGMFGDFTRGFFGSMATLPGDVAAPGSRLAAPSNVMTLPEIKIPAGGAGNSTTTNVNIHVAANAKPDAALSANIKRAVQDGLGQQNRNAKPAIPGGA